MNENLYHDALALLKDLIATPSPSQHEDRATEVLAGFFESKEVAFNRYLNNIWAVHPDYRKGRRTLLLNSHIDTIKPTTAWTFDPFTPLETDGRIYGLGSNDAGASLVSLIAVFRYFLKKDELPCNLIFTATAEEEISGHKGIEAVVDKLGPVDLAVIGEPTGMALAIAEKGLIVLDCKTEGRQGHAARDDGKNAIYEALHDIEWFRNYSFDRRSEKLGSVKMSVTGINAGYQHNVVPDVCNFVVDVRTNENYTNDEIFQFIRGKVRCHVEARSLRLNSSGIPEDHPLVITAKGMNIDCIGSPTISDQTVIPYTSVKIGPGDPARSHTADEFVECEEIRKGIEIYIKLLEKVSPLL